MSLPYEEFRKRHKATRCYEHFSSEQRANLRASHRLGSQQRQADGEFYYTHPMVPNRAFRSAGDATRAAYAIEAGSSTEIVTSDTLTIFRQPPIICT